MRIFLIFLALVLVFGFGFICGTVCGCVAAVADIKNNNPDIYAQIKDRIAKEDSNVQSDSDAD